MSSIALAVTLALFAASSEDEDEVELARSSTQTLSELIAELNRVDEILTSSLAATSTAVLSEEGEELLSAEPSGPEPGPGPATAPHGSELSLVFTGGSQGIGAERYHFELPWQLQEAFGGDGEIIAVRMVQGVLVQGSFVLTTTDHRVESALAFLRDGRITCGLPDQARVIRTRGERLIYELGPGSRRESELPRWLQVLDRQLPHFDYQFRRCRNERGSEAILYSRATQSAEPIWRVERFEFRRALHVEFRAHGQRSSVDIVGVPSGEAARRLQLLAATSNDALFVDTGSFVDGSSRRDGGDLSIHRPLAFEMLARLQPTALVPGATELIAGVKVLKEEAKVGHLPYIATNWESEDPDLALPRSVVVRLDTEEGPLNLAFLGAVDPGVATQAPVLRDEGVMITEPLDAVQREITVLAARPEPPDLVIVLANPTAALLERLARRLRGVDLLIADGPSTDLLEHSRLELSEDADSQTSAPLLLPLGDIGRARLQLFRKENSWRLESIDLTYLATGEDVRPDPRVASVLTAARAATYVAQDRPLLAAKVGPPLAALSAGEWSQLICEAVLLATGADVVLLPELPPIERMPGPVSEIVVADRLAVLDRLEVDRFLGDELEPLLARPLPGVTQVCGGEVGVPKPRIRGRPADYQRAYRLVTTDRALALGLEARLAAAHRARLLAPSMEELTDEDGEPLTLRRAVLSVLRGLREEQEDIGAPVEPLLLDSAKIRRSSWTLALKQLELQAERFQGTEDPAFLLIPETQASRASSLSVGIGIDLALHYDGAQLLADLRTRARYRRFAFTSGADEELEDDLRFSSSVSLPGLRLPTGPFAWMPFGELLFDTELTPVEQNGGALPRQADLSFTAGAATSGGYLERFRLGAVVLRALQEGHVTQVGLRTEASGGINLGPGLRFTSGLDGSVFFGELTPDPTLLRFRFLFANRLALALTHYFDVGAHFELLLLKGRAPETAHTRAALLFGLSLALHGVTAL